MSTSVYPSASTSPTSTILPVNSSSVLLDGQLIANVNGYSTTITGNGGAVTLVANGQGTTSINLYSGPISVSGITISGIATYGINHIAASVAPNGNFGYALTSNNGISVFNTTLTGMTTAISTSGTVLTTITGVLAGQGSIGTLSSVTFTPDSSLAYITVSGTGYGTNSIVVVNTATNAVTATISGSLNYINGTSSSSANPVAIATTVSGTFAYVTNGGSTGIGTNSISVINTATNTISTTISGPLTALSGSQGIAITSTVSGQFAYVTNYNNNTISVFNTATNSLATTISGATTGFNSPSYIATVSTVSGTWAYVLNSAGSSVSVINTANNTVSTVISGYYAGFSGSLKSVFTTPSGNYAYLYNQTGNGIIHAINTTTNTLVQTQSLGYCVISGINASTNSNFIQSIGITPDGSRMFFPNPASSNTFNVFSNAQNYILTSGTQTLSNILVSGTAVPVLVQAGTNTLANGFVNVPNSVRNGYYLGLPVLWNYYGSGANQYNPITYGTISGVTYIVAMPYTNVNPLISTSSGTTWSLGTQFPSWGLITGGIQTQTPNRWAGPSWGTISGVPYLVSIDSNIQSTSNSISVGLPIYSNNGGTTWKLGVDFNNNLVNSTWTDTAFGTNTFGVNTFVAVGNANYLAYNTDGVNWQSSSSPAGLQYTTVAALSGYYVANQNTQGTHLYSQNGTTWSVVSGAAGTGTPATYAIYGSAAGVLNINSVQTSVWMNTIIYTSAGYNYEYATTTPNTWNSRAIPFGGFGTYGIAYGTFNGTQVFVVSAYNSAQAAYTSNATTWTLISMGVASAYSLGYTGQGFVGLGSNGDGNQPQILQQSQSIPLNFGIYSSPSTIN